jgi:hypothetical protein
LFSTSSRQESFSSRRHARLCHFSPIILHPFRIPFPFGTRADSLTQRCRSTKF